LRAHKLGTLMRPARFLKETLTLKDGRTVVLRPIDRDDAEALMDLHTRLSPESQYYRFFGPKPTLTRVEAEYLAAVDFHRRFAIVAEETDDDGTRIVAVGRFDINEPNRAEAAIVVRDDYQGLGLGKAILERMRELGRGRGLEAFTAEILAENAKMIELLRTSGLGVEPAQTGVVRVVAPIDRSVLFRGLNVLANAAGALLERRPTRKKG
jgi:GNAT superfamily N-acetyltransferase